MEIFGKFNRIRALFSKSFDLKQKSLHTAYTTAAFSLITVAGVWSWTPLGRALEDRVATPALFELRHRLNRSPMLDSRMQIFAFDDNTLQSTQKQDLTLHEWLQVLRTLIPVKPRLVVFDRIFSTPWGLEKASEFVSGVKALPFPVAAGTFLSNSPIPQRPTQALGRKEFSLLNYLSEGDSISSLDGLPEHAGILYGPNAKIVDAFSNLGHILHDGLRLEPFLRLSSEQAIPHLSLLFSQKIHFESGSIVTEGGRIPEYPIVNLSHPAHFYRRTLPLRLLVERAGEKKPEPLNIPKDAIVLILPEMYTGSTTFLESPFGLLPSGFWMASAASSVLSGQWLSAMGSPALFALFGALVGMLSGLSSSTMIFAGLSISFISFLLVSGATAFIYFSALLPWFPALISFFFSATITFVLLHRRREAEWNILRACLEGALPEGELRKWIGRANRLTQPSGQVLSVMFIDIVGFTRTVESQAPRAAFDVLREQIARISDLVHQYGGTVEKTLGDGLLCFFGMNTEGEKPLVDHADQAVRCAVHIQRENIQWMRRALNQEVPVFPLRIGINTAGVFLGNLGSGKRIDLTVIGHGVNLARRFEEACESGKVLIGRSTADTLLDVRDLGVTLTERLITFKHARGLQKVVELDPFENNPEVLESTLREYHRVIGVERVSERWVIPEGVDIEVRSSVGSGRVVNFSDAGMRVNFSAFLGKDCALHVHLVGKDEKWNESLARHSLQHLLCEVRWGRRAENPADRFFLGLEVKNLLPQQQQELVELFRKAISSGRSARLELKKTGMK